MESFLLGLMIVGPALLALFAFSFGGYVLTRARPLPRKRTWLGVGLLIGGFCVIGCYGVVFAGLDRASQRGGLESR